MPIDAHWRFLHGAEPLCIVLTYRLRLYVLRVRVLPRDTLFSLPMRMELFLAVSVVALMALSCLAASVILPYAVRYKRPTLPTLKALLAVVYREIFPRSYVSDRAAWQATYSTRSTFKKARRCLRPHILALRRAVLLE